MTKETPSIESMSSEERDAYYKKEAAKLLRKVKKKLDKLGIECEASYDYMTSKISSLYVSMNEHRKILRISDHYPVFQYPDGDEADWLDVRQHNSVESVLEEANRLRPKKY